MQKVVFTGAAGDIGTRLRKILRGVYPHIRASDIRKPADLAAGDDFVAADLADLAQVEEAVAGMEGVVHLGGHAVEGSWPTILNANIIGCYNLFEAARRAGVKRVVFASSNHAIGFYPRSQRIGVNVTVRPDSRAEDFRAQAMAAQAKLPPDPVAARYQGGPFCSAEYDADRSDGHSGNR